jgi:CBS domain-containing protein
MSTIRASALKAKDMPKPSKIVTITGYTNMQSALNTLRSNHVLSAPVLDLQNELLGQIDLVDIIVIIVHLSKKTQEILVAVGLMGEQEQIDFSQVRVDRQLKELLDSTDTAGSIANFSKRNPLRTVAETSTLYDLVRELSIQHRVCVVNNEGKLSNYVTQSAMIKFLKQQPDFLGSLSSKTIGELGIGTSPVLSVKQWDMVVDAFKIITLKGVTAVAVVDGDGRLVGTLGAHDMRSIDPATNLIDGLVVKAESYLTSHSKNPVLITEQTTLKELVDKLEGHHRAIIVDSEKRPVKVISIGDVLKALV